MILKFRNAVLVFLLAGATALPAAAQVKLGDNPAVVDTTAVLELSSTKKGFLPPRMLQAQMAAILNPATGLMAYCLDCTPAGLRIYNGTSWVALGAVQQATFTASSLSCAGTLEGPYEQGLPTTSASTKQVSIGLATPGAYNISTDTVNGVSFRASGSINTASTAAINLVPTGTPLSSGDFTYAVSVSGQPSCTFSVPYTPAATFACDSATATNTFAPAGLLVNGTTYNGTYTLPYTGSNGSSYAAATVTQNGLTLTRASGTYASGGGNVVYTLSGTYTGSGITQAFTIAEGCTVNVGDVVVSTLAGNGTYGSADGSGAAAQFNEPMGIALDTSGNVYVADQYNSSIRKITPAGVVSTFAGGPAAQFGIPTGVAVDASGNVYVADQYNHRIRKITPAGVVSTLAGSGTQGSANGAATAAQFNFPVSVAVDASGNVYVGDLSNWRIRKITPAGMVSTLAGSTYGYNDGTGTAARFSDPTGVAVDTSGNVYVADRYNHSIRKITPAGVVSTLAGSGTEGYADGTGTAAEFSYPTNVTVDAFGNVYVADQSNNRIRKITAAGVVTTLAGSGIEGFANGPGATAKFYAPSGVAVDASGKVYVAEQYNHRIRKITP